MDFLPSLEKTHTLHSVFKNLKTEEYNLFIPKKYRSLVENFLEQKDPHKGEEEKIRAEKFQAWEKISVNDRKYIEQVIQQTKEKSWHEYLQLSSIKNVYFLDISDNSQGIHEYETHNESLLIVRVGKNSDITLIETNKNHAEKEPTNSYVITLFEPHVHVRHYILSQENSHLAFRKQIVKAGTNIKTIPIMLGGKNVFFEINTHLIEASACAVTEGSYISKKEDRVFLAINSMHKTQDTKANILIHGAGTQNSYSNFYGNIFISENGKNTNSYLTEECLLLHPTAKHDAAPNLEINTNDVKASHSASVTQIDDAFLFYAQSRGIEKTEAKHIIVESFLMNTIENMPKIWDTKIRTVIKKLKV